MCIIKLFCILCIGFSVNGFIQNTEDICNQNPGIICDNLSYAVKCHKLSQCMTAVWGQKNNHIVTFPEKKYLPWSDCRGAMNMLYEKFEALYLNEFAEILHEVCGQTSLFSNICHKYVTDYQHELYYITESTLRSFNICNNSDFKDSKQEVASYGLDVECELCKQFAKKFKDLLISSKTEEEFKEILEKVCTATKGFQAECLDIVKNYYDIIYKGLAKQLEEQKVCHYLGFCESPKEVDGVVAEVYIMFPEEEMPAIPSAIIEEITADDPLILEKYGAVCYLCEYFFQFTRYTITLPVNEKIIKKYMKDVCQDFRKSIQTLCYNFMSDAFFDIFFALLIEEIDPKEICPLIKACPQKSGNIVIDANPLNYYKAANNTPTAKGGSLCPLCITAAQEFQGLIRNDIMKETFEQALGIACDSLHHNLQEHCIQITKYYHEKAYDLVHTSSPQEFCTALSLCSENEFDLSGSQLYSMKNKIMKDDLFENSNQYDNRLEDKKECDACMAFMKRIEKDLDTPDIKERINEFVRNVCNMFPEIKDVCLKYENTIVDLILTSIIQQMTPDFVCKTFDLCPNKCQKYVEQNNGSNPIYCTLCTVFINGIKEDFKDRRKQEQFKKHIQSICNKAPSLVKSICVNKIKWISEVVVNWFVKSSSLQICTTLALCGV